MGHQKQCTKKIKNYNQHKQFDFSKLNWQFRYNHGGILRNKRRGRTARPLSTKAPIHLVFKTDIKSLRRGLRSPLGFKIVNQTIQKYARRFFIKIEQVSINHDHIHLLVRFPKRSHGQAFLRTVAGQIAQQFQKKGFLIPGYVAESYQSKTSIAVTDTPSNPKLRTQANQQAAATSYERRRNTTTKKSINNPNNRSNKVWKYRPFTRVIQGWKPYQIVRNYIQLNIKEAAGEIHYKKDRLKGLSSSEWEILWG